ncbi:MAG: hypothetical protein Q9159_003859 [Coniocarpon cinnabarinum]
MEDGAGWAGHAEANEEEEEGEGRKRVTLWTPASNSGARRPRLPATCNAARPYQSHWSGHRDQHQALGGLA